MYAIAKQVLVLITVFVTFLALIGSAKTLSAEKLKALIIDGQNNHADWPKTTMMMQQYLLDSQLFDVDIARTKYTWQGQDRLREYPLDDGREYIAVDEPRTDPEFQPSFADYHVVVCNFGYQAAPWPQATQTALEKFVSEGGGFVVIHAADNSFGDWPEYNRMIGLGGWGGRTELAGPYVYLDESEQLVRDDSPGDGGSHGAQHCFQIVIRDPEHPIVRGLPRVWMHAQDELYDRLRGPAQNMSILATAYSDPQQGGSGRHEPMIMTVDYGRGRVFHTPLGHADYSMECVGFITVFVRGTQWAAVGRVTQNEIPDDFPSADQPRQRAFAAR